MSAKLTRITYQVSRMFDLNSLHLFFVFHKIVFQIKVCLLITGRRDLPFIPLIQIRKIRICFVCMIDPGHMRRVAVWKHLTVDLEALLDKLRMIDGVKRLEVLGQV